MLPQSNAGTGTRSEKAALGRADRLARSVAAEILAGNLPVGTQLAAEAEFARENRVTIATARAALRRLESLGLTAQGAEGVHVAAGEVRAIYQTTIEAAGGTYVGETSLAIDRRRTVRADGEIAVLLGVPERSEWVHLTGLRFAADPTFGALSWVDAWLGNVGAAVPDSVVFTSGALERLLGVEIAEVHEELSVAPLTPAQARYLRARGGDGSLHVMRRYLDTNGSLAAALLDVHPAGRISVVLRSRRRAR